MTGPKKMTEAQLAANRRNARRSTGPRTAAGKATSRWNALKHGVLARAVIPPSLEPYESRADFDALLAALHDEFAPATVLEEILVERIATAYWRLARLLRAEAGAIARRQALPGRHFGDYGDLDTCLGLSACLPQPRAHELAYLDEALPVPQDLRRLMAAYDRDLLRASDKEVLAAALVFRRRLQQDVDLEAATEVDIQRSQGSIPALDAALAFSRYEAALERQLYRALQALLHLQPLEPLQSLDPVEPPDPAPAPDLAPPLDPVHPVDSVHFVHPVHSVHPVDPLDPVQAVHPVDLVHGSRPLQPLQPLQSLRHLQSLQASAADDPPPDPDYCQAALPLAPD